jgi:hypothetical protein
MRHNKLYLVVVHEGGARVKLTIDEAEYTNVIEHFTKVMKGKPYSNYRYVGTSADGTPYRLMLGTETLGLSLEGGCSISSEEVYTVTVNHEKGGEAEVCVTKPEYEALMQHIEGISNASNYEYFGTAANGFKYRLMLGNETFALTIKPQQLSEEPLGR